MDAGQEGSHADDRFVFPPPASGEAAATVAEAGLALSDDHHPSGARASILACVERLFGARIVCLYEPSPAEQGLSLTASRGLDPALSAALGSFSGDARGLVALSARTRRPALSPADEDAAGLADCLALRGAGLLWSVAIPLVAAERLLGVVLYAAPSPRLAQAEEATLVYSLAGLFSLTLSRAGAWTEIRSLRDQVTDLEKAREALGLECARLTRELAAQKEAAAARIRLLSQIMAERGWFRAVIARCPIGIILTDPSGAVLFANLRAFELTDRRLQPEHTAVDFLYFPDGSALPEDERPSSRALRGEVTRATELLVRRPDGSALSLLVSAGPIHDDAGTLLGAVVVFDDMTRLKEIERQKEEWTSVVAHDLRQPATTILGYGSMIERRSEPESTERSHARHIVVSALRLSRMISDLLDISRIDTRHLLLDKHPLDLPSLVRAILERTGSDTAGHGIALEVVGEIPVVDADAERIEQVLGNLLSNAARYGDPDSPIRVIVERRDREVAVSVENRGPGIPSEEVPMLFERHFRGVGRSGLGLGLGLYIVRGLVEAHGGRIWVDSPAAQLTVFRFTLPFSP